MKARFLSALAISAMAMTAWAHHSYGMFYELDKAVLMKGRVGTISFVEPHVRLTIETTSSGSWEAEWTSPNALMRAGVGNDTLHIGDLLEIEGSPARDPNRRGGVGIERDQAPSRRVALDEARRDRGSCITYYRVRASQARLITTYPILSVRFPTAKFGAVSCNRFLSWATTFRQRNATECGLVGDFAPDKRRWLELMSRELIAELHFKYGKILVGFHVNIQGSERQRVPTLARVVSGQIRKSPVLVLSEVQIRSWLGERGAFPVLLAELEDDLARAGDSTQSQP